MNRSDTKKLSDLLVKVANAPMEDAVYALRQARNIVYLWLITPNPDQKKHAERVEARQRARQRDGLHE